MGEEVRNPSIEPQQRVFLTQCSWDSLNEPGAYVELGSGDLYRIPKEAVLWGGSMLIRKESLGASRLARISKDPYITTYQARMICSENNVHPNF